MAYQTTYSPSIMLVDILHTHWRSSKHQGTPLSQPDRPLAARGQHKNIRSSAPKGQSGKNDTTKHTGTPTLATYLHSPLRGNKRWHTGPHHKATATHSTYDMVHPRGHGQTRAHNQQLCRHYGAVGFSPNGVQKMITHRTFNQHQERLASGRRCNNAKTIAALVS